MCTVLTLLTARTLTMLSEMTRKGNMLMRKQNKFLFVNKNENQISKGLLLELGADSFKSPKVNKAAK